MKTIIALRIAIAHWTWLANNPTKTKADFFSAKQWVSDCSLCEADSSLCNGCPMVGYWPSAMPHCTRTCTQGVFGHWGRITKRYSDGDLYGKSETIYDDVFLCLVMVEAFEERLQELRQGE